MPPAPEPEWLEEAEEEAEPKEKGNEEESQCKEGEVEEELTTHAPKDFERGPWLY